MTPNSEHDNQESTLDTGTMQLVLDGRYRLDTEIKRGRMGNVYKGTDLENDRAVAVKVIRPFLNDNYKFLSAFERETAMLAGLDHPNIVRILDVKLADRNPHKLTYLVMEYVKGIPLDQYLDENESRLDLGDLFDTFLNIAEAIDFIHQNKIIHRNLKSENILVRSFDGVPKLVDFGFGYLSDLIMEDGKTCFNPAFASPEQCLGNEPEPSSDIYSFATTLYFSLGKDFPYMGSNHSQFIAAKTNDPPLSLKKRNTAWPPGFCASLDRALAIDPKERPLNCRLFIEDLRKSMARRIDRPLVRYLSRTTGYIGTPVPLEGEIEKDAFSELPSSRPLAQSSRFRQATSIPGSLTPLPVQRPKKPRRRWTAKLLISGITLSIASLAFFFVFPQTSRNLLEQVGVNTYHNSIEWIFHEEQIDYTGEKFKDVTILFESLDQQVRRNLRGKIRNSKDYIQEKDGRIVSSPDATSLQFMLPNIEGQWEFISSERDSFSGVIEAVDAEQVLTIHWSSNTTTLPRFQKTELRFNQQLVTQLKFLQEPEFFLEVVQSSTNEPLDSDFIEMDRVIPTGSFNVLTNAENPKDLHFSSSYFSRNRIVSPDWLEVKINKLENTESGFSLLNLSWSLREQGDLCKEKTGDLVVHSSASPISFYLPPQEQLYRVDVIKPRKIFSGKSFEELDHQGGEFVVAIISGGTCSDVAPKDVTSPVDWVELKWESREVSGEYFLIARLKPQSSIHTRRADIVFHDSLVTDQQSFSVIQSGEPCVPEFLWAEMNSAVLRQVSSSDQQLSIAIKHRECLELSIEDDFSISKNSHESFQTKSVANLMSEFQEGLNLNLPRNSTNEERLLDLHFRGHSVLTLKQEAERISKQSTEQYLIQIKDKPAPTPSPTPAVSKRLELKALLDDLDRRSSVTLADVKNFQNNLQRIVGHDPLSSSDSTLISQIEKRLAELSGNSSSQKFPIEEANAKWVRQMIDLNNVQYVLANSDQEIPIESIKCSEILQLEFNGQTVSALAKCRWRLPNGKSSTSTHSIIEFVVREHQVARAAKVYAIPDFSNDPAIRMAKLLPDTFILMSESSVAVFQPNNLENVVMDIGQPHHYLDLAPLGSGQFIFLAANTINPSVQILGVMAWNATTSELFLQDYTHLNGEFTEISPTPLTRMIWLVDSNGLHQVQNAFAQQEFGWILPGMPTQKTLNPEPFRINRHWNQNSILASTYSGALFLHEGDQTPIQFSNSQPLSGKIVLQKIDAGTTLKTHESMASNAGGDLVLSNGSEVTILLQP